MPLRKSSKVDLLAKVPLFSACSKAQLGAIASIADEIALAEGTTLMTEGERGREFAVIVAGTVTVTRKGRKVGQLGAGDHVGEVALIANIPRTATVVAASPLRVLVISDRAFARLLDGMPSIARKLLASVGPRLAKTSF